jgi:hypothetical protein
LHVIDETPTVDLVDFHVAHLEPRAAVDQAELRLCREVQCRAALLCRRPVAASVRDDGLGS